MFMIKIKLLFFLLVIENSKNEYSLWITSLQKAWDLVGQELVTHGNLFIKVMGFRL